jgi:VanZ family protein
MTTAATPLSLWSKRALKFWKSAAWAFFVLGISAMPGQSVPDLPVWQLDKLVHAVIYFGMAFFLYWDLKCCSFAVRSEWKALALAMGVSIVFGGMIELLQKYAFVNRSGSWLDFFANGAGVLLFWICVSFYRKRGWETSAGHTASSNPCKRFPNERFDHRK